MLGSADSKQVNKSRILNVEWTRVVNILHCNCMCGNRYRHRADRGHMLCPHCKRTSYISRLREFWLNDPCSLPEAINRIAQKLFRP